MQMGPGTKLAKIDIAHAYRNVSDDSYLLEWSGREKIHTALPFGLHSAPKVFSAISDALEWILFDQGMSSYLDNGIKNVSKT